MASTLEKTINVVTQSEVDEVIHTVNMLQNARPGQPREEYTQQYTTTSSGNQFTIYKAVDANIGQIFKITVTSNFTFKNTNGSTTVSFNLATV